MMSQRRGCEVPKAEVGGVTQVPEILLHRLPMPVNFLETDKG
jgi:hypothetical protein